jgi:ribosomal protein S8
MAVAGNLHSEQGREINAGYGNRIVRLKDGWMVDGQGRPMRAEGELLAEATA